MKKDKFAGFYPKVHNKKITDFLLSCSKLNF